MPESNTTAPTQDDHSGHRILQESAEKRRTVDSQATKSIFEIWTHIVPSIEATIVLHLNAPPVLIESKCLLKCSFHIDP